MKELFKAINKESVIDAYKEFFEVAEAHKELFEKPEYYNKIKESRELIFPLIYGSATVNLIDTEEKVRTIKLIKQLSIEITEDLPKISLLEKYNNFQVAFGQYLIASGMKKPANVIYENCNEGLKGALEELEKLMMKKEVKGKDFSSVVKTLKQEAKNNKSIYQDRSLELLSLILEYKTILSKNISNNAKKYLAEEKKPNTRR